MSFLPGHHHGFIAGGGITLTFVASANDAPSVVIPTVANKDLIIIGAIGQSSDADPPNVSDPSGFSLLTSLSAAPGGTRAVRHRIYAKIADGTESGNTITPFTGSSNARATHCLVLRPNRAFTSFANVEAGNDVTSGDPSDVIVGTGLEYNLAISTFSAGGSGADLSSRASSPTQDGETTQDDAAGLASVKTAFRWHIWNPKSNADPVTSQLGDTGLASALMAVAVLLS